MWTLRSETSPDGSGPTPGQVVSTTPAPENGLLTVHKRTMTNFIYLHQPEQAFSFTRLPNFLFEAPTVQPLSNEAKLLYAFILRRAELSRKNGWADEYGRIFLYYPSAK